MSPAGSGSQQAYLVDAGGHVLLRSRLTTTLRPRLESSLEDDRRRFRHGSSMSTRGRWWSLMEIGLSWSRTCACRPTAQTAQAAGASSPSPPTTR